MCLKNALLLLDRLDLSENRVKINSDIASVLRLNRFVSSASEQSAKCFCKKNEVL